MKEIVYEEEAEEGETKREISLDQESLRLPALASAVKDQEK
jgi:hypothetical protein